MASLTLEPYISLAVWLPLAIAAGALLVGYSWQSRGRLAGWKRWCVPALMGIALLLPLLILLNPTWVEQLPPPAGKPRLTLLIDRSASMQTTDVEAADSLKVGAPVGVSRFKSACQIAEQIEKELKSRFTIDFRTFAEQSSQVTAAGLAEQVPQGSSTDLARAITESFKDHPSGQAIVLLSDGADNMSGAPALLRQSAEKAKAMSIPLFTQLIGTTAGVSDLSIDLVSPQEMSFVDQELTVTALVTQRGQIANRGRVTLHQGDAQIAEQELALTANGTVEVSFTVKQSEVGVYRYELRLDVLEKEVTPLNNRATLLVRVVDEPIRLLLLEGKPYWDSKFLMRTLAADRSVQVTNIVQVTKDRFMRRTLTLPPADSGEALQNTSSPAASLGRITNWTVIDGLSSWLATEDMLSKYEVIVLGREVQAFLSDDVVQRLKRWLVAGDGALVCYRGAPVAQINEGLAQLLPVRWSPAREQRFRVQLTEPGKSLRWLPAQHDQDPLSGLPSLATVTQSDSKQPLAVVLANSQVVSDTPAPVISYQRVGNGRVMVIEGAGMWRWAMLSPEHQSRDQVYGSLWRSLIRWLVTSRGLLPSESIALRSDKVIFATNEPAGLTVLTRTPLRGSTTVTLSGEALGKPQAFAPISVPGIDGQARVVFGKLPEGRYDVSVTEGPAAHLGVGITFEVRDRLTERIDVAARGDLMRLLAESSGGEVLQSADAGQLAKALNIHLADAFPSRFRRRIAWDRWWVLAILCTTWATTWAIRRRSGLI